MKKVYLCVTVEVPDDETDKHWQPIVEEMAVFVRAKGYDIYDYDWGVA